MTKTVNQQDISIDELFSAGAHFGYSKSRRHPSAKPFIFGVKNGTEIIDLEQTKEALEKACEAVHALAASGKTMVFVSSKPEAYEPIKNAAVEAGAGYATQRWIGGTFTNFPQIRKRINLMLELQEMKETGNWEGHTKKEIVLLERELARLEKYFGGLGGMEELPTAMFVVDPRKEHNAVREAKEKGITIFALASSDCNLGEIDYPIPANDTAVKSIEYIVGKIAESYREGVKKARMKKAAEEKMEKAKEEEGKVKTT